MLVIIPFDAEEDAIIMANDADYGLAAYVQLGYEARVIRRVRAGTIRINGRGFDKAYSFRRSFPGN